MQVNVSPPMSAHFLLWSSLTIVLSRVALRLIKGVLITHYRNKAAEGRLDSSE